MAAGLTHLGCKLQLPVEIVVHHPILPEDFSGIGIEPEARPERLPRWIRIGRRGIEGGPTAADYPRLHPTVCVGSPYQLGTADGIVNSALKSSHHARGNIDGAQHNGHRGCEVLTVALFPTEQEIGDRV